MDNLKDLYAATRAYELKNGLAAPRLSTSILKERIGNNENIAGKLQVWRRGEWREALGYISKDELLRLAPEPTPEEWQVGDVLKWIASMGGWCLVEYLGPSKNPKWFTGRVTESHSGFQVGSYRDDWNRELTTLHHRPTPEERAKAERLAANAKLKAEWEKEKFAVQIDIEWENWCDLDCPAWDEMTTLRYRRKPDPVYVPWTAEDDLLGVKVRSKSQPSRKSQVIEQNPSFVWIGDAEYHTYADFFAYFEQLDGTPCGKVKEEGK